MHHLFLSFFNSKGVKSKLFKQACLDVHSSYELFSDHFKGTEHRKIKKDIF